MSWRDCIVSAVETGRVKEGKADEALAAYDEAYELAIAQGEPDGAAVAAAADAAVESLTTFKKAQRWERINEMQRAHELLERLKGAKDIARELDEIMVDLELAHDSIMGVALSNQDLLMSTYKPKKGGLVIPTKGLDDIARAAYGDVRSPEAGAMAEAIQETMEVLRQWANRYGANIPENPNRHLFQTHDAVKVDKVSKDTWVNEHLEEGVLAWDLMRYGGKEIPVDKRREVLENTYDGIKYDGMNRREAAQGDNVKLATRLNRDKFLYYADGEAWLRMQEKYGAGTVYEQFIGMTDAMAKDIALLQVLGPSAHSMKEFVKREARALQTERGGRNTLLKVNRATSLFDKQYEIHSRHVISAEGNLPVQTFTAVRTVVTNALLGGVFIPSLGGDISNAKAAKAMLNMPTNKAFSRYWQEFIPTPQKRQEAIRAGVIFDNGISLAHSKVRYFGLMDGPHWARRMGEVTYRVGLTSHHTQVARNAAGKEFIGILADHAGKKFDELPFAPFLSERGITSADWDRLRATPLHDVDGAKFLRPIDLFNAGEQEPAEKFMRAMQMFIRTWVPDTSLRSRAAMGEWIDPNTVAGQAIRTMTTLMSFPVSIYFNQLRRIASAPGIGNKMKLMAKYFAWMTLGGAFITQAKALVAGQNPYQMLPLDEQGNFDFSDTRYLDFWGRSVVNGGSLGILGDVVFNNINLSNSPYNRGNPTEEYFKSLHRLTIDNLIDYSHGKEVHAGKDALDFLDKNVPDFWMTKLIINRYIMDELLQQADPEAYRRKQAYEQEHEEGMWWGIGDEPEAPALGTAIGQ